MALTAMLGQLLAVCLLLAIHPTPSSSQRHPSYSEHFTKVEAIISATKGGENSFDIAELKEEWPALFSSTLFQQRLLQAAEQLAGNVSLLESLSAVPNVSAVCLQHTKQVLVDLMEGNISNVLQMIDAMGKPSPDIMLLNLIWPGALKECLNITYMNMSSNPLQPLFSGEYCTAYITVVEKSAAQPMGVQVATGICVPESCSSMDISILINIAFGILQIHLPQYPHAICQDPNGKPLDSLAVAGIVVVAVFLALMLTGTVIDVLYRQVPQWKVNKMDSLTSNQFPENLQFNNENDEVVLLGAEPSKICEPGLAAKVLIGFSVYTNGAKLLSTDQVAGTLSCVHGIRFLSMTWVVLGHTFLVPIYGASNLIGYFMTALKRWTFQGIINASVSVDTFFVLSGLLVAYLSLKEMKKNGGKMNWFKFYFHRFWRLTPPYMLIIFIYLSLGPYWGSGPLWSSEYPDRDSCKTSWWTNLLYINNFVDLDKLCLAQSWYLANDMQFYILSPLIFVPFYFSPIYGTVSALVFLLATTVTPAAVTMTGNFQAVIIPQGNQTATKGNSFEDYYIKPYNRMGPYIIGMLTGYLLYRTNCKAAINKVVNVVCWAVATATALAVLYGLYDVYQGHPLSKPVNALYNAVSRTAWGMSVGWVVFACVTGNGGFVNTILSWKALIPLSRLTYCIYLLHMMILNVYLYSRDTTFYYSDSNIVVMFLAWLVACYMIAAVVSLAFEAPMMALEKLFLHRKKNE